METRQSVYLLDDTACHDSTRNIWCIRSALSREASAVNSVIGMTGCIDLKLSTPFAQRSDRIAGRRRRVFFESWSFKKASLRR
jgi:hypothetical protein